MLIDVKKATAKNNERQRDAFSKRFEMLKRPFMGELFSRVQYKCASHVTRLRNAGIRQMASGNRFLFVFGHLYAPRRASPQLVPTN